MANSYAQNRYPGTGCLAVYEEGCDNDRCCRRPHCRPCLPPLCCIPIPCCWGMPDGGTPVCPSPVITTPAAGGILSSLPVVAGTGAPGATIRVSFSGYPQELITTVNANGSWSVANPIPLAAGSYTMSAVMEGPGRCVTVATRSITIGQDSGLTAPVIVTPPDGGVVATPYPTIRGTAAPGSTVGICIVGIECRNVPVPANGIWTFIPTLALAPGDYTLTAYQVNASGQSPQATSRFTVSL